MTCTQCQTREMGTLGRFDLCCTNCCADLVLQAYPSKPLAERMLAAIAYRRDRPPRAEILECVKQKLAKPRSAMTKSPLASNGG